jgi:hypothetical protein
LSRGGIDPHDENGLPPTELHRHRLRSGLFFVVALMASAFLIAYLFSIENDAPDTERYVAVGDFPSGHVWFNTSSPLSLYTDLRGHVIVVLFSDFAMLSDLGAVEGLHGIRDSMSTDPVFFVVSYVPGDSSLSSWRETVTDWGIDIPVIVDGDGAVRENFSVDSIPQMLLIDTHGRVITRYASGWQEADVEGLLRDLLEQGVASRSLALTPFRPEPGEYVPAGFEGSP